jgi:hypothetical protein
MEQEAEPEWPEIILDPEQEPTGIDDTALLHKCDVYLKSLTHATEYYYCQDCPATFMWCKACFYKTDRNVREPGHIVREHEYEGKVITNTQSGHMHRFTVSCDDQNTFEKDVRI